ncbi:TadE/TadG family type IV pilus assembly protein, partial [Photobacterium sanguinicancri]
MNISSFKRQKGVFAIEFALGFFVLFMFTMLIFETCRVTYIAAVLDYATAEAARDARVQLEKNTDLNKYMNQDCERIYKNEPEKKKTCLTVNSFSGDQFQIWFYWFVEKNGGALWQVLTSASDMKVTVKHYKDLNNL